MMRAPSHLVSIALFAISSLGAVACASADRHDQDTTDQAVRGDDVDAKPKADLAERLHVAPEAITVESSNPASFGDSCLDCAGIGESCTLGSVEGHTVVLRVPNDPQFARQPFTYHVDNRGDALHFCTGETIGGALRVPGPMVEPHMLEALAAEKTDTTKVVIDIRALLAADVVDTLLARGFRESSPTADGTRIFIFDNPGIYTPGQRVLLGAAGPTAVTTAKGAIETVTLVKQGDTSYTLKDHFITRAPGH